MLTMGLFHRHSCAFLQFVFCRFFVVVVSPPGGSTTRARLLLLRDSCECAKNETSTTLRMKLQPRICRMICSTRMLG